MVQGVLGGQVCATVTACAPNLTAVYVIYYRSGGPAATSPGPLSLRFPVASPLVGPGGGAWYYADGGLLTRTSAFNSAPTAMAHWHGGVPIPDPRLLVTTTEAAGRRGKPCHGGRRGKP